MAINSEKLSCCAVRVSDLVASIGTAGSRDGYTQGG